MIVNIDPQAQLEWRTFRSSTSDRWIATCESMNLTTEAATLDELHSLIDETIQLVLMDLLLDDELPQYLDELGWRDGNIPTPEPGEDVKFSVPWHMVTEGALGPERRAH